MVYCLHSVTVNLQCGKETDNRRQNISQTERGLERRQV
jgi:hypothetical protein